jgi:prepilin-type N-terminal cleavage/methylation domain-containing protein
VTRRGFSLIEVLISVVIFSAVILGLAGLSFQVARRSVRATDQALVISSMLSHLDRATTIPYDSLSALVACDTTTSGQAKVIGCTTVTASGARTSDVKIVVRTTVPGGRPDTIAFTRGKSRSPIPLR